MNQYIDQLTAMRMNTQGGHTSPHKAVMLLAVIDMIASGKNILFPEQKQFSPKQQALEWREQRLKAG